MPPYLRGPADAADRWVRFHSLPRSKRYADAPDEASEISRRHHALLLELGLVDTSLLATSWFSENDVSAPVSAAADRHEGSVPWQTVPPLDVGDSETFVRVSEALFPSNEVDRLLSLAAEDRIFGLIIAPQEMDWLYAPYDGGADVFARSTEQRDKLRNAHPDWLSSHPDGL